MFNGFAKMNKQQRIEQEKMEATMDGFFGRIRYCKGCKTKTKWDWKKTERYCPIGCFHGSKLANPLRLRLNIIIVKFNPLNLLRDLVRD